MSGPDQAAPEPLEPLFEKFLELAPFLGWSGHAFDEAVAEAGLDRVEAERLYPRREADLAEQFGDLMDARMAEAVDGDVLSTLSMTRRIRLCVMTRLTVMTPYREAALRGFHYLLRPQNGPLSLRIGYRTMDRIWRLAGDTATDFNFYTKRATLAGVFLVTARAWFEDLEPGAAQTEQVLDRQLARVMRFERFKGQLQAQAPRLPSPLRLINGLAERGARFRRDRGAGRWDRY